MAVDKEAAPHLATIERLARGEDPAAGAPTGEIPGRGAGYMATKLLVYTLLRRLWRFSTSSRSSGVSRPR